MKYTRLLLICLSLCGAAISAASEDELNKPAKPNIVLIMADDLGGRDLSVYGNRFNEAPNIDRLANQGMLFHNAYAAPVCSATRASIQSGQYPARIGIFDFIPGHWRPYEKVIVPKHRTQHLPEDIVTLGDVMQRAGYKTGYFGKWHLNNGRENLPNARGYNTTVGSKNSNERFGRRITCSPAYLAPRFRSGLMLLAIKTGERQSALRDSEKDTR